MKKIGFIMDDIREINIEHDTTFGLMLEARRRGYLVYYMQQTDLFLHNGEAFASMQKIDVQENINNHWQAEVFCAQKLSALDIIFMRKDPPVNNMYLYTTQLLDLAEKQGVLIVNKPESLRNFNEKLFIAHFPQCCAPTLVSADAEKIKNFWHEHGDIIAKPLHGLGGLAIFRITQNDPNLHVIVETLTANGKNFMMAQKFLPDIKNGDKRILLINGEPISYALARYPKSGETRANMAAGGTAKGIPLTDRDRWICTQLAPTLRAHGIWFAGIDVIGDYLTEINITSPTCMRELDREFNLNIASQLFDAVTK